MLKRFIKADEGMLGVRLYHSLNLGLLGIAPAAFVAPKMLALPLDVIIALGLPLHGHIGMNYVITDYVPKFIGKAATGPARIVQAGVTLLTAAGLLKLTFAGPGITNSILKLWSPPPSK